ncbi:unnamed protein product [Mytilus coruscus]|uniref:Integrase catalytic domain-containing protein n=1 Tax=Mytilus coruscus TaxID=42192 RepID=A0A6J8BI48_MYTCO|nr:unnamed protein product [Mytilus coruscus]
MVSDMYIMPGKKPGPGLGKSPMQHRNVYRPMECIAIDLMGPLPTIDHWNEDIMVVFDYFTKRTEAYALKEHCAQTVADKPVTEFISRFGTPCRIHGIHTEQGREFESKIFASICDLYEIDKTRTTPYHPHSDSMVERYNRTLQQILSMFVKENKDDLDSHLPYVTMAYRACTHESTKCSPNLLTLGREISLAIDIVTGSNHDEDLSYCPYLYIDAIQIAFDKVHENLQQFEIWNKVLRWYPPKANKKLGLGWIGPYKITRKLSDITYEIQDCQNSKLKVVHVNHLKPLHTRDETFDAPEQEEQVTAQTQDQFIWIDYTVDDITHIQDENVHNVEIEPASPKMEIQLFADGDFDEENIENRIEFFYTPEEMQCPIDGCNGETAPENAHSGHPDSLIAPNSNNHSGCKSFSDSETQTTATELAPLELSSITETRPELESLLTPWTRSVGSGNMPIRS